ncbi:MAG TPA: alpha/beta fold hydrolase [Acidimicrobiales bacterium]|nr:alpha/beta fold hydrolase [Acidimicrobiales bacterium]
MSGATPILAGAEPFSALGTRTGVLVLHGLTGSPQSMRPLAEAFAGAGFTVELPLLPGHGRHVDELKKTGWRDWLAAAEGAYADIAARCDRVFVAGLSMGGTLTAWLLTEHPEIAGAVLVNAAVEPAAAEFRSILEQTLEQGIEVAPGIGSDIADPDAKELAFEGLPIQAVLTLFEAQEALAPRLASVRSPLLVFTSRNDHVVPPTAGDYLAERVSGPAERVWLEKSFHVATLDYDKDDIAQRAVAFVRSLDHD